MHELVSIDLKFCKRLWLLQLAIPISHRLKNC